MTGNDTGTDTNTNTVTAMVTEGLKKITEVMSIIQDTATRTDGTTTTDTTTLTHIEMELHKNTVNCAIRHCETRLN